MNEPNKTCPKCKGPMTELQGGLWRCPKCVFEDEPPNHFEKKPDQRSFWILLLLPSVLALLSFLIGQISDTGRGVGMMIGVIALVIGLIASIYCGISLASRFFKSDAARFLFGLIFILAIGFVNFMIILAGCAGPGLLSK